MHAIEVCTSPREGGRGFGADQARKMLPFTGRQKLSLYHYFKLAEKPDFTRLITTLHDATFSQCSFDRAPMTVHPNSTSMTVLLAMVFSNDSN